ncbi:protein kinase-like protein rad3 [Acephala macrosclerotiorum]|nr:protein kinase-like protein rad3 [Acephala macrosclerotiorum]
MAPIPRNAITNGRPSGYANGASASFDAPPSTIAAQLISNLSTTNQPSRSVEQDELKRLFNEVSALENDLGNIHDLDAKLEHKHKLLYAFGHGLLEKLSSSDPFVDNELFLPFAPEAIDVFIQTIKDFPALLDYTLPPGTHLRGRGQEPLWIWLFPRILALFGRPPFKCLTEKTKHFFSVSFQVVSRSPKLWNLNAQFFSYLKECVENTLDALKQPKTIYNKKMSIVLPISQADYPIFFSDENDPTSNQALYCTYTIEDSLEGFDQVTQLLLMLVDISMEAASCYDATPAFEDHLAWTFDSFCTLHDIYQKWQANPSLYENCPNPDELSFCSLRALISSIRDSLSPTLLRKGYITLSILCGNVLQGQNQCFKESTQLALCGFILNLASICEMYDSVRRLVSLHLVPIIKTILSGESVAERLGTDFQRTAMVLFHVCDPNHSQTPNPSDFKDFDNGELSVEFLRLGFQEKISPSPGNSEDQASEPPNKRLKVDEGNLVLEEVIADLCEVLGSQRLNSMNGLHQVVEARFTALDDAGRRRVFDYLGRVPCAASGHLTVARVAGKIKDTKCALCEGSPVPKTIDRDEEAYKEIMKEAILTFSSLLESAAFHEGRKVRLLAMFALRRFAAHYDNPEFLNLEQSQLGQWCISSLKSSMRELRIAAGRTLPAFLRGESTPNSLTRANRFNTMNLLRSFIEGEGTHLQETCVLAWGQLGRITEDDELCLVLLALVKYLGNSNPIVSAVAFTEILQLAESAAMTIDRLFSAFWGVVAIEAVKDLLVRPQTSQLMADLLKISVTEFLILTQSYTLPYLIMTKKIDVISRIAEASNKNNFNLLMHKDNLVSVIALLLQQSVADMETYVLSLLRLADVEFKNYDLNTLLRIGASEKALLLLKAAAEADDSKKSRIRFGLQFLAEQTADNADGKKAFGTFFDIHILGLVTKLSDVINDPNDGYTVTEKRLCVKTAEELVKVAKNQTRIARPQLCAILQAAFAQKGLEAASFSAWETMLRNMEDEDVETMLESTFTTVIQRWNTFDEPTQIKAETALQYLVKERSRLVRNMIVNLPSLSHIPELDAVERLVQNLRTSTDTGNAFAIFSRRLGHENSGVVTQALVELKSFLRQHQGFLQASASSEQPDIVVSQLVRSILDSCVKFHGAQEKIPALAAECLGLVGCLDPNRVETVRTRRDMVVVSNFADDSETTNFILLVLEEAIVPAFLSTTDTKLQGFLSWVMQEILHRTNLSEICVEAMRNSSKAQSNDLFQKWLALPQSVQDILTPFFNSKFNLKEINKIEYKYPIFRPEQQGANLFGSWLRSFVLDLLQKHNSEHTNMFFPPLRRAVRFKENSVANLLLPYVVLYVIIDGTDQNRQEIGQDLLNILRYEPPAKLREEVKLCVEAVFRILDYIARWTQERQIKASQSRGQDHADAEKDIAKIKSVVEMIPPEIISARAVECKSYSRALFYWEQHIRNLRKPDMPEKENTALLEHLQDIYSQIDEPDGIEGISAHLQVVDINQQILGHRKAGRWTAAQSWYEIQLAENPQDVDVQLNLLTCLRESGQLDVLLNYVEGMCKSDLSVDTESKLLAFATEASWATGKWAALNKYTSMHSDLTIEDFNVNIGRALLDLQKNDTQTFKSKIDSLRKRISNTMSVASTSSLSACHDDLLKLHVLTELEMIAGTDIEPDMEPNRVSILESLTSRLEVVGAYLNDKQYLLGIRRAALQLSSLEFTKGDIASTWLTSARLARKGNAIHQSFNAVLHAAQLGDESATIEHARLLWKEGHHRKAIQSLQGAIASNAFMSHNKNMHTTSFTNMDTDQQQNLLKARAHLLLAKWLDRAGQTNASALRTQYQLAAKTHMDWEKGHYYLGRHYNKLLEAEKIIPFEHQKDSYLRGEMAKLVIENYLRSLCYGTKYLHQTLPRVLTLWLDLGNSLKISGDSRTGLNKELASSLNDARRQILEGLHSRWKKYIAKLPAYMFYTALPQIVARIAHQNTEVFRFLQDMIIKVIAAYPRQALWSLLAVCASTQSDRKTRGATILSNVRNKKTTEPGVEMRKIIKDGEKICEQLLMACNAGEFHGNRTIWASLKKDLGFDNRCVPSQLAVPVEKVLTAALPTLTENPMEHKAFSRDVVTIHSFLDEVLVLSSLQKPRKLTARGSDGRLYGIMCKPKDDLRKDQRLMEFNGMINRSLKRDAESSRRQLYIKTYAVTPLNEECGLIEWVDGLKTLRDILLGLYKPLGILPNYREIEAYCEEAIKSEDRLPYFTDKVLGTFPPIFHRWFVQQFPEPEAWFIARLRYTRSCAVMSMVGTMLGLGDRHGENILFEEGNGGTFHVDFNCLFDKGLTFAKPERVPFRLTHNMIDAMGMYGYEGPFRKSSELTLKLLRQHEETLMTILEAFVYDPTLDLLTKKPDKKKREGAINVPQTAQGVLDSIQRKIRGLLAGESVPLGVEGQVDELIKQATNQTYLAGMYIGWCSFL